MAKQAKEKFHSEATEETYELLNEIVKDHHSEFINSNFQIRMKHGGWKSKGRTQYSKFKILDDDFRRNLNRDAILYLNADLWAVMSLAQRKYVIDEAMYSLDLKHNAHFEVLKAADGRPLLTSVAPDIQGFIAVMQRHGAVTSDVKRLASALAEMNQLSFDDIEKEEAKQIEEQSQHDGVKVTVDNNGVVQEVEDENQTTIEQYINEGDSQGENDQVDGEKIPFTDPPEDDDDDELF